MRIFIAAMIFLSVLFVGNVAFGNSNAPSFIAQDGREIPDQLPEFFTLATLGDGDPGEIRCPNGRPARIPTDDRFLSEVGVVTASGERFASPWHWQQHYDQRVANGEVDITNDEDGAEIVTLGAADIYRPDVNDLCRLFRTDGSLTEVLGTRAAQRVRELPQVPANLIQPRGVFNSAHR